MTVEREKRFRWPPLTILWIIAIFAVPVLLKRALGWPGPPPQGQFDASSRFIQHFVADFILGLPVFIPFLIALWWVNRKRETPERNVVVSTSISENNLIPLRLVFSLMVVTTGGLLAAFLAYAATRYGFKWPGLIKSVVSGIVLVACLTYGIKRGDKDLKLMREMRSGEKQVGLAHVALIMLFVFALTGMAMWILVGPPANKPLGKAIATSQSPEPNAGGNISPPMDSADSDWEPVQPAANAADVLRFDGMYWKQDSETSRFIRFFEDGMVIAVSYRGEPAGIADSLDRDSNIVSRGQYKVEGSRVSFDVSSEYGASIDYTGEAALDRMSLDSHSKTTGHKETAEFEFFEMSEWKTGQDAEPDSP